MKTLFQTNPHLQNRDQARLLIARSTRTSCGVEGIEPSGEVTVVIDSSKSDEVFAKIKNRLNQLTTS